VLRFKRHRRVATAEKGRCGKKCLATILTVTGAGQHFKETDTKTIRIEEPLTTEDSVRNSAKPYRFRPGRFRENVTARIAGARGETAGARRSPPQLRLLQRKFTSGSLPRTELTGNGDVCSASFRSIYQSKSGDGLTISSSEMQTCNSFIYSPTVCQAFLIVWAAWFECRARLPAMGRPSFVNGTDMMWWTLLHCVIVDYESSD
jgi:hypothetical protein